MAKLSHEIEKSYKTPILVTADKTESAAPKLLIRRRASPLPAFATLPQCALATVERWPRRPPQTIAKTVVVNLKNEQFTKTNIRESD